MSTTEEVSEERDPYIGARVSEEFKTKAEMRAREKGMNMTEYLKALIEEDLEDAEWIDSVSFE